MKTELKDLRKSLKSYWKWYFWVPCIVSFAVLTVVAFLSSIDGYGEPLSFFDGISVWPSTLIQLFCGFLAVFMFLLSVQSMFCNNNKITQMFEEERGEQARIKNESFNNIYGYWKDCCKVDKLSRKDIYIFVFAFIYLWIGIALVLFSDNLLIPYRGMISRYAEWGALVFSMFCIITFAFYVIIKTINYYCFFSKIINNNILWDFPKNINKYCSIVKVIDKECKDGNEECRNKREKIVTCLAEYDRRFTDYIMFHRLIIHIIAKKTEDIGRTIIYPFIVSALLLFSYHKFFDYWNWTIPLIIVVSLSASIILYFSVRLFYVANIARKKTVAHLTDERFNLLNTQVPAILYLYKDEIQRTEKSLEKVNGEIVDVKLQINTLKNIQDLKDDEKEKITDFQEQRSELYNEIVKLDEIHNRLTSEQRSVNDEKSKLIEQKSQNLDNIIEDIQNLKNGAFAPLTKNPILIAILTPLGGIGSISLLQHLPQLLNK